MALKNNDKEIDSVTKTKLYIQGNLLVPDVLSHMSLICEDTSASGE